MLKYYRYTPIFILLVILGVQWGFYKVYTSQFPDFVDKSNTIHIHGALWMSWLVLLVIQPVLISSGRAQWHRRIGKVSYLLGPLLIVFLFLAGRESYWKIMASSTERDALGFLALDSRGLISFIVFWTMAMVKRKIPAAHMRYMIATGILAIGPGVGRGLVNSFNVDFSTAFTLLDSLNLVLAGALLAIDVWKRQDPRPYLVVFFMLLLGAVLWQIRDSGWWQSLAKVYAAALY